jgi:hypothetical protein
MSLDNANVGCTPNTHPTLSIVNQNYNCLSNCQPNDLLYNDLTDKQKSQYMS